MRGLHRLVLNAFVAANPRFKTSGFNAAMRELGREVRFLPDAFDVDQQSRTVSLIEVEITHPINNAKAYELADLTHHLSPLGWTLRVTLVDRSLCTVDVDVPMLVAEVESLRYAGISRGRPENTFRVPLEWAALVAAVERMAQGRANNG